VQWWQACDRLLRLDNYTAAQVEWMIRWATADEFWSANIRSMPKLREKFSTLKARAVGARAARPAAFDRAAEVVHLYEAQEGGDREEVGDGKTLGSGRAS